MYIFFFKKLISPDSIFFPFFLLERKYLCYFHGHGAANAPQAAANFTGIVVVVVVASVVVVGEGEGVGCAFVGVGTALGSTGVSLSLVRLVLFSKSTL